MANLSRPLLLLSICLGLSACSTQRLIATGVADQLARQGQAQEDDLQLAREAAPFYLKLSESVLKSVPDHLPLAEAVAAGFTQYAYAFVAFEADRVQASDMRAAQALHQRAARLYARAQRHALNALTLRHPALLRSLSSPETTALRLAPDEVGLAYWGAAAWAARISLSKDDPEQVADLPAAMALARLAWRADPRHGRGALASLMGTLEASRPGGDAAAARRYFDLAAEASGGGDPGVWVARAEALALPAGDRADFEGLLRRALGTRPARPDLYTEVMRQRAGWLLSTADERF